MFATVEEDHAKCRITAWRLLASAALICPHVDEAFGLSAKGPELPDRGPFQLLVGIAVENILKALIVSEADGP